MRLLEVNHGDVRIFSERPFGYKRYIVEWQDGSTQMYNGLWYRLSRVQKLVEKQLGE